MVEVLFKIYRLLFQISKEMLSKRKPYSHRTSIGDLKHCSNCRGCLCPEFNFESVMFKICQLKIPQQITYHILHNKEVI